MQRGTPSKNRSFFSMGGSDSISSSSHTTPRTPADVSRIREQAGTTPRALDRDFLASSPATSTAAFSPNVAVDFGATGAAKQTTTKSKMFNRRTWTKEENDQLQEGLASLGGPAANLGKNVRAAQQQLGSRSSDHLQQYGMRTVLFCRQQIVCQDVCAPAHMHVLYAVLEMYALHKLLGVGSRARGYKFSGESRAC